MKQIDFDCGVSEPIEVVATLTQTYVGLIGTSWTDQLTCIVRITGDGLSLDFHNDGDLTHTIHHTWEEWRDIAG